MCCEENLSKIAALEDRLNDLESASAWFVEGHPLMALQESSDIALFDTATGWGAGKWVGWAISDGTSYTNGTTTVATYDMRDKVPVGSGVSYTVGQSLGAATHTLTTLQIPAHNHTITDPGHDHNVTDPGHVHAVTDLGHTHAGTGGAHSHTFTTNSDGSHTHQSIGSVTLSDASADETVPNLNAGGGSFPDHIAGGAHTHTGTTDSASPSVTITAAFTGVAVQSNTTGINQTDENTTGITLADAGGGQSHNNMQPSVGTLWVQKIY